MSKQSTLFTFPLTPLAISAHSSTNSTAAQILKSTFLTSLTFASEQGAKLNAGKCNYVLFEFGSYVLIALFYCKVTAIFVANSEANIGEILDLEEPLAPTAAIFTSMVEQATF